MTNNIPEKLICFFKNATKDVDDGYEYASELNRILNSDDCQMSLDSCQIERLRNFADEVKKVGEMNYYSEERIKEIERDFFGSGGILGYLGVESKPKPEWFF